MANPKDENFFYSRGLLINIRLFMSFGHISIFIFLSLCACANINYSLDDFIDLFSRLKQQTPKEHSHSNIIVWNHWVKFDGSLGPDNFDISFNEKWTQYVKFDSSLGYVNFVKKYHETFPHACLTEAFEIDSPFLDYLLLSIISTPDRDFYSMDAACEPISVARMILTELKLLVEDFLFEPYDSQVQLLENAAVLDLFFQFFRKYSEKSNQPFSETIFHWTSIKDYLLTDSHNGAIDYNLLFVFPWPNGILRDTLPFYDEENSHDYLIFAANLHRLIRRKDFKLFQLDHHPYLVLLLAFILDNINDLGRSDFLEYNPRPFYTQLTDFFNRGANPVTLLETIKDKKLHIIDMAKEKLSKANLYSSQNFILPAFEKHFSEDPSKENQNILFQLKCLLIIKEFLIRKRLESCGSQLLLQN
jgi:hypothetical protein